MKYCNVVKKLLTMLLALSVLFSFSISAQDAGFIISGEQLSANQGDTIAIRFYFDNNPGISIISLNLDYDSNVLALTEIVGNPLMSGSFNGNAEENFIFWLSYNGDVVFNGMAFTVFFYVKDDAQMDETTVSVSPAYYEGSILNNNYDSIVPKIINATIKISGNYKTGDVNCDGFVDSHDILNLVAILLKKMPETENCDVTGDSRIDIIDLVALKKLIKVNNGSFNQQSSNFEDEVF